MTEVKLTEWRPVECGTRIGDIVQNGDRLQLKVKCRRCTKKNGVDTFHVLDVDRAAI